MCVKDYVATCRVTLPGVILYHCMTRRRKIAIENINLVFKDTLTKNEKTHLIKAFFSHLAKSLKETILTHWGKETQLPKLEVRGLNHLESAIALDRGVLILSAHLGSWEFILPTLIKQTNMLSHRTYIIRKTQGTFLQKQLISLYNRAGINIIESSKGILAGRNILRKKNILFFVFDQHFSTQNKSGIAVEFFGKKAGCAAGLAYLTQLTGASVIPVNQFRANSNLHIVEFHPAVPWVPGKNNTESIYKNTLQYNQIIERYILQHPEQWFGWIHRRWKLQQLP